MYDARDLTTHGVVVGMTGSGKTGLGIAILEEAAIDGIPCVIIDPKGDLSNLLLQFPDLDPRDFEPWLNPEDARQKKMSPPDYAAELSKRWRQGLADSYQKPERVAMCRESSDGRAPPPAPGARRPAVILVQLPHPQGRPAPRGAQPAQRRHRQRRPRPDRHPGRPGAVARTHPYRPAAAPLVDARQGPGPARPHPAGAG